VVVPLPGRKVTPEEILDLCREHLAKHKVPKAIIVKTDPLDRIASGKINKRMIRQELDLPSDTTSQGAQQ